MRGAIENISPILLFDMVPNDALDVLEGRKEWRKDSNGQYRWIPATTTPSPISGTAKIKKTIPILYNNLHQAIQCLRASHLSITSDMESITKTYDNLSVYYRDTSYTPHGNVNALDLENTALSAYRQIVQLFDRLHGYSFVSPETENLYKRFLDNNDLGLPEARTIESIAELDTFPTEEKNRMTEIFSDIKENVLKGVLILPANYHSFVAEDFRQFFNIPWSLIVDYNKNTAEGMYATFSNEEKAFFPEVMLQSSDNDLYIADGKHRHSWLFAEGNNNNYSTIIVNRTNSELRRRNSKIANCIKKTEEYNASDFAFILVYPDFEKISKLIEMLYNDSAYIDNFETKFHFYILTENSEQQEVWKLAQEEKDYGETIYVLDIKAMDLLSCASEIAPLTNNAEKKFTLYSNNKIIEVQDSEMCKFYESGIEFVDVTSIRGKNDWDFYDGAEITWKEIQEGKAIKRQGYSIYLENLKQKINSNRSIYKDQFNYYPGSGATTFLRQIAYDIDIYSKSSSNFQCLPVFIKRHEPALLLDSLTKLTSIYDGALLVVFESHVLSEESYAMIHFADKMIERLPEEWKDACLLISFVYKYTGKSVSLSLLKTTLSGKDSLSKWPSEVQKVVKRLLVEIDDNGHPTNSWRPRYRVLGECILASHFNTDDQKWITPSNLYLLSKRLINTCSSFTCEINTEDEQILQRLFTEKSEEDFRRFDDFSDYLKSFPLVVQDIRDYGMINELMNNLITFYPDNPYFLAHYSRYLYEYTSNQKNVNVNDTAFVKAQELIDKATRCNEKSDKVYHMQGTLYNRMIRVFRRNADRDVEDSKQSANNVKYWIDEAIKAFSSSELYSPLNPYGYMTEGQTIQQGIEALAICLDDSKYLFCDKEPWTEYVNRFNKTISQLSELIKSSDNNQGNEEMYRRLCNFHVKLIGADKERCEIYFQKALSLSKTKADRVRFSQLYYWSTIYYVQQNSLKLKDNQLSDTLSLIRGEDYNCMEKVLLHAIQDDCIPAFKQLHELRLYSDVDYSIEDAILHWKLCVEKCERQDRVNLSFTLMNAYYMLESYYAAKYIVAAIKGDGLDDNDKRQYFEYREKAINSAHKYNRRGTITAYYYLGNNEDARILISARDNSELRRKVECQISDIKQRSGVAIILPCGLEASFGAGKKTRQNIGDTDYWQLGFRYEGIGLYDERDRYKEEFNMDTHSSEKQLMNQTDKDTTVDDTYDTTSSKTIDKYKIGDKIELSERDANRLSLLAANKKKNDSIIQISGQDSAGSTLLKGVYKKMRNEILMENGFHYVIKNKLEDLYDDADVVFELEEDLNNPRYKKAINVRISD